MLLGAVMVGVPVLPRAVAQALPKTPAAGEVVDTTPCDVLAHPADFDGKTVRMQGTVQVGLDDFLLRAEGCTVIRRSDAPYAIWIDLPEGTRSRVGPAIRVTYAVAGTAASPLPQVRLERSRDFKVFEDALAEPLKRTGMCLGCTRNTVTATVTGHIDALNQVEWHRAGKRVTGIRGYGHLNHYRVRLVLESVSAVTPHPVDYGKAAAALDQASPEFYHGAGDPVRILYTLGEAFPNGSATFGQIRRASVAFGTAKEPDGVVLRPGITGEVPAAELSTGAVTSSDGLVAYVTYDPARLTNDALLRALASVGSELADLRENAGAQSLFDLDAHGIGTAVLTGIASRQRTLTMPGGFVVWNAGWEEAARAKESAAETLHYVRDWKADVFVRPPAVAGKAATPAP